FPPQAGRLARAGGHRPHDVQLHSAVARIRRVAEDCQVRRGRVRVATCSPSASWMSTPPSPAVKTWMRERTAFSPIPYPPDERSPPAGSELRTSIAIDVGVLRSDTATWPPLRLGSMPCL